MAAAEDNLARRLRRAERWRQVEAVALVAPLLLFLLLTFALPITGILQRSVDDPEVGTVLPRTLAVLKSWDGHELPPEPAFSALVTDLAEAKAAGTVASAARRLNYDLTGFRSLLMNTARKLPEDSASAREALIELDARWGERATWAVIQRAAGPLTDFYLLAALDLVRTDDGGIANAPADQSIYRGLFARTFGVSLSVTVLCLLLGFPLAHLLATLPSRTSNLLMILVLLPFWTSLLVRTAAWIVLLQQEGLVNQALLALGVIEHPLRLIYNRIGVVIAMTHVLLPFMILPLYSVMRAIPPSYLRAARSLGAPPLTAFLRVYLPQTLPGIAAGTLMVFILALGYYITPALVGGAADQMISYFIAFYTTETVNWGMASALGAVLLAATLLLYGVYSRLVGAGGIRLR